MKRTGRFAYLMFVVMLAGCGGEATSNRGPATKDVDKAENSDATPAQGAKSPTGSRGVIAASLLTLDRKSTRLNSSHT